MNKGRASGFTLIELLIVVAIIGILASMLIPNLLDSMEKAKQKRSMSDIRNIGTGMMAWLTDHASAAAAGRAVGAVDLSEFTAIDYASVRQQLVPHYLQYVTERDGWKNPFDFYLETELPQGFQVMAVRSTGKDGVASGEQYTPGSFEPTAYTEDIVWTDGFFVRWPQKLTS